MMSKNIYVVHEYGAPSHYYGLDSWATANGYNIYYRELWRLKNVVKHPKRWVKFLINICFLCLISYKPKCKIVLCVAPFNNRLPNLMKKMQKHEVYYHTSYTCWDGTFMQYEPKNQYIVDSWKYFTNAFVRHIFVVSEKTKTELIKNQYAEASKITVVNHSYCEIIQPPLFKKKENTFIFVGRLTENKGIIELLEIFEKRRDAFFTIVGDGPLSDIVQQYARRCENITYLGYIKGLHNIIPLYQKHCFMVLNSKKTKQWEELFGIMLIEGMACGCVPISIKHTGPKEIITDGVDGFLYEEGGIEQGVIHGIQLTEEQYSQYRKNAIKRGSDFYYKKIMDKWEKIL